MSAAPKLEETMPIGLSKLRPSPQNPRKHLGDLTELAASMKSVGLLEPLVVRWAEKLKAYEIVCGHRRHGAAALAGFESVSCVVRDYSDDQVLEVMIVENSQRADVHPLDEADGFRALLEAGRTVQQIADKIGRPASFVAQRLQLGQLVKAARKAFDEEKLTLGAAMALARLPEKLQLEALDEALGWHQYGEGAGAAVSSASMRKHIEEHFMLRLDGAPFPTDDAALRPKAGACTTCPKRTGNQRELFADVKSADMCTDTNCYREKTRLYWPTKAKDARAAGNEVLEGEAAKKALKTWDYNAGYRKLTDTEYVGSKPVPVSKLAKKHGIPITLVLDPETGAPVELVKRSDFAKAFNKADPAERPYNVKDQAAERKRKLAEKRAKREAALAIAEAVRGAEHMQVTALIGLIVRAFATKAWTDIQRAVLERRGIKAAKHQGLNSNDYEGALSKLIDEMNAHEVAALGVEIALQGMVPRNGYGEPKRWKSALDLCGVDIDEVRNLVAAETKGGSPKAAAKTPAARSKKAAKSKTAKRVIKANAL